MDSRRAGGGNRMMTSTTLQTNDIWSKTIGHDPHAGDAEAPEDSATRERQEEGQYYCRLATTAWKVQLCRTHANNGSV